MLGRFFTTVFTAIGGGKYTFNLRRQSNRFALYVFQRGQVVPLANAAAHYEPLKHLLRMPTWSDGSVTVSPSLLNDTQAILRGLRQVGVEVHIDPDVERLQLVMTPPTFRVRYVWDGARNVLAETLTHLASYYGDGWFVEEQCYWQVPGMLPEDDGWLRHSAIDGHNLLVFVSQVTPNWRLRNLPYDCTLSYSATPAVSITVSSVREDAVALDVTWAVSSAALQAIPSLPGYVINGDTLMPGIVPQALPPPLSVTNEHARLSGQQIPQFMRATWPVIQTLATGDVESLVRLHQVRDGTPELILTLKHEMRAGLGVIIAVPEVSLGNTRIAAAELSQQVASQGEYVRIDAGWLPRAAITQMGIGPLGRLQGGISVEPITLSSVEMQQRGSERLNGPWSRIQYPVIQMPQGETPAATAKLHIEFLRSWRIPGGIISTAEDVQQAYLDSIAAIPSQFPAANVLIVGTRGALTLYKSVWEKYDAMRLGGQMKDTPDSGGYQGLVVTNPSAFQAYLGLQKTHWTVVCVLETDTLIRSSASQFFMNLRSCPKSLVIGQFSGTEFLDRTHARNAISQIFHVTTSNAFALFMQYGLRDPTKPAPTAPDPIQLLGGAPAAAISVSTSLRPAEITVSNTPTTGGLAIPQRPGVVRRQQQVAPSDPNKIKIVAEAGSYFSYGYVSGTAKFIADAHRFVGNRSQQATFVPFAQTSPTYDAMTYAQRQWYFYWRGQVRGENYIDTDLSYIFVYIYELINTIGVVNAKDGFEKLWRLWMAYQERFPRLNVYLADWLLDYLLASHADVPTVRRYLEALPSGMRVSDPDLLLLYVLGNAPLRLPDVVFANLVDAQPGKSKFALDGNLALLNMTLAEVLQQVNAYLLRISSGGIFDFFRPMNTEPVRRPLFRSARYGSAHDVVVRANVYPYTTYPPLREFLTAIVKHTENRLRERNGYRSKLRGYTLDPVIQVIIDDTLGYQPVKGADVPKAATTSATTPPQVVINMARVEELQQESDEVQRMLLDGIEPTEPLEGDIEPSDRSQLPVLPTPEAFPLREQPLESDNDHIGAFFAGLSQDERKIVDTFMQNDGRIANSALRRTLPGQLLEPLIDRINDLADTLLGDILILEEDDDRIISEELYDDLASVIRGQTENNR